MKMILITAIMLGSFNAIAAPSSKACFTKAAAVTAKFAGQENYDQDGFNTSECQVSANKAAVVCTVNASKGDGAATDTYQTVLDLNCKKAYRVELIGEE